MQIEKNDQLRQYFINHLPEYFELLRQLVNINSFTTNPSGVNLVGERTAKAFESLGFQCEAIQPFDAKYGKHIFLTHQGRSNQKIALISHLDTVFSLQEEIENEFNWRVEDDRIYGPGTVDIKGGTVMIFMVLEGLKEYFPDVFEQITWLVAADATEEVLSNEFSHFLLERLDNSTLACLVFEGGRR